MFSSSKYPLPEKEPDYKTVFADVPESLNRPPKSSYKVQAKLQLPDEEVVPDDSFPKQVTIVLLALLK